MSNTSDRRNFLKSGAILAGLAATGAKVAKADEEAAKVTMVDGEPVANWTTPVTETEKNVDEVLGYSHAPRYGVRSRYEAHVLRSVAPPERGFNSNRTPLQDLTGTITPNPLHFYNPHGNFIFDINPAEHRLLVHGMVDRPTVFTMAELKRLPFVSRIHFLQCAGQSYGVPFQRKPGGSKTVQDTHGFTSCAEWTGVPVSTLMQELGVQTGAKWLIGEGGEWKKHAASIPLDRAMEDGIVAYAQNGEAIRPENGYPLRLILPGVEGMRNIRWLRRLYVSNEPAMNEWEVKIYTMLRTDGKTRWYAWDMEPNSVITFPSGEQQLPGPGMFNVTGLAWTGTGKVHKVEVSTDGGHTWQLAKLQEPVLSKAHTRFHFPWRWDGKEAILMSRSMDEFGNYQPTRAETEEMWKVKPDYFGKTTNVFPHFYACQPWKITADGKVHNAMWDDAV